MPHEDQAPGSNTGDPTGAASRAEAAAGETSQTASPGRPRIAALDVLRGFTLCEILLANIQLIAGGDIATATQPLGDWDPWLGLPIFSLLFGIGFSLLLDSAAHRVSRPWLILLRRLLTLLAIGLAHMLLWPGEILTKYAIAGLLVLLPSIWLPRLAVAALAAVLVTVAVFSGGGPMPIAGLFLLGSALVRYGVVERIERSIRGPLVLGLVFATGLAAALWAKTGLLAVEATTYLPATSTLADLLLAGIYVCGLLVLLRTPLRPALRFVFAPLGRMALSNYVGATLLVLAAGRLLGLPIAQSSSAAFQAAGVILMVQWLFSILWLRRFRQGPMEWLWRWATWARRPTSARPASGDGTSPRTAL
jgi:uncharacterized protein